MQISNFPIGWGELAVCKGKKQIWGVISTHKGTYPWIRWGLNGWRRQWQPTPEFLPGESQGWGSLVGCRLWVSQSRTRLKRLSSSSSERAKGWRKGIRWASLWWKMWWKESGMERKAVVGRRLDQERGRAVALFSHLGTGHFCPCAQLSWLFFLRFRVLPTLSLAFPPLGMPLFRN